MKFSSAQKQAIYTHGNSLLVSAAAGSGKTAVLVERVIQKILAGGDISRLWIMTFTNAAAAEMRQKIESAIAEKAEADPENTHLQNQMLAVSSANISTIHSACKRILEQNFQGLDIDPGAVIAEESVLDIMFDNLLEDLVEEIFERSEHEEEIADLVSFFAGGRSDGKFLEVLRSAYGYWCEQPYPDQIKIRSAENIFEILPKDALFSEVYEKLSEALAQYKILTEDECFSPLAETKLWINLAAEQDKLKLALDQWTQRDFGQFYERMQDFKFASWSTRGKAYQPYEDILPFAKTVRQYAKNSVDKISFVYAKTEGRHLKEHAQSCRILHTLFLLIAELDTRFLKAKKERSLISFNDLERFSLQLLTDGYNAETDELTPSAIALEMQSQIDEIIIDEYQDTNRKQDLIFRALSKNGSNIFMVGDIKQSIYRFREACPDLFREKKETSIPVGENFEISEPSYLYLNQNFRSHSDILNFANQIFRECMSDRLGQVCYDEREQLYTGGLYPEESKGHVELDILLTPEQDEDLLEAVEMEAEFVADKIKQLHGQTVYDAKKGENRKLQYGDMAILARSTTHVTECFETALRRRGISCVNQNASEQFLDVWEVKMLRAFLQVISNPYRDISLITLMYSDFYDFSAAELAKIRAGNKYAPFYDAVRSSKSAKCVAFLKQVEELRKRAVGMRTFEILQSIFAKTHILEKISQYPDGDVRVANMRLMLRYAQDYEKDSYKGLFSFLNYLDKMSALNKIIPVAKTATDPSQCVQILSIHKSKGLEYPVCFLVATEKEHRNKDVKTFISNRDYGVAVKIREDDTFTEYESLSFDMIKTANRRENLSEEMRILYVALTRPKAFLYVVASSDRKSLENTAENYLAYNSNQPWEILSDRPSNLNWMLFALRNQETMKPLYEDLSLYAPNCTCRDCSFTLMIREGATEKFYGKQSAEVREIPDLEKAVKLSRADYPFEMQTKLPIKMSVSEVKGMREQDPEAVLLIPDSFSHRQPSFIKQRIGGNVKGNAVHKFMQFADFKELAKTDGFKTEKQWLEKQEFLTKAELELVDEKWVSAFVRQPLFKDMITADILEKEKRFFFSLPACEIFKDTTETEPILLQGVLDCYYEKNGTMAIVDYKTDRLNSADEFAKRYALQLRLYRTALQQLCGKNADKLYIYSFYLDEVIEIS